MSKILLVTKNQDLYNFCQDVLQKNSFEVLFSDNRILTQDIMNSFRPDIVIFDYNSYGEGLELISSNKDVKSYDNIFSILIMPDHDVEPELMKNCNAFLPEKFSKELLLSTVNSILKSKKTILKLTDKNNELARSLYQLNVFYNISSQFAGTLDREKLINIMLDGLDKSLSFELACVLTFKNEHEPLLIISSVYDIPDSLLEALKLRATFNYISLFDNKNIPFDLNVNTLKVEKRIKNKNAIREIDFSILRAEYLLSQIKISENFFGFIEIFREKDFSTDDTICFQTIIQQVSLPLKSAVLYEKQEQTNKKLLEMEHQKSEFISLVSHELRTPLTSIKNSLDIISQGRAGSLTDAMSHFLSMGKRNVEHLKGIINDLLDISKIEAGKMDYNFEVIKINSVVNEVKDNLEELAKNKNIDLVTTLEDNFTDIYADAFRLRQILMNLVSNALKFTGDNGKIEIRTKVLDASEVYPVPEFEDVQKAMNGKYLQVLVKDNGIGIQRENLRHVFDKFAQIEGSLQRKVGGTGLGLPIVKQLLESHNGFVWCNSKPDKGSSFYFAIPVSNDKNNFMVNFKQNLKKAKINNQSLSLITIRAEKELLNNIIKDVIRSEYMKESAIEDNKDFSTLYLSVDDKDKVFVELLKKQIKEYVNMYKDLYENSDIIYGYGIYPIDALDDFDLVKRLNKVQI